MTSSRWSCGGRCPEGEQALVTAGLGEEVLRFRAAFQEVPRRVTAFMSANHLDPALAAEVFVLQAP